MLYVYNTEGYAQWGDIDDPHIGGNKDLGLVRVDRYMNIISICKTPSPIHVCSKKTPLNNLHIRKLMLARVYRSSRTLRPTSFSRHLLRPSPIFIEDYPFPSLPQFLLSVSNISPKIHPEGRIYSFLVAPNQMRRAQGGLSYMQKPSGGCPLFNPSTPLPPPSIPNTYPSLIHSLIYSHHSFNPFPPPPTPRGSGSRTSLFLSCPLNTIFPFQPKPDHEINPALSLHIPR